MAGYDKNLRFSFIGAGHLAEAIIVALVEKLGADGQNITIFDQNKAQYKKFANLSLTEAHSLSDALNGGDMVFLTVRPGDFPGLLPDIKNSGAKLGDKIFVSTAAGITTKYIEESLGQKVAIVRTMPNTPVAISRSMTALCKNENATRKDFEAVCDVFSALGEIIVLDESKMNKIVSVNGSSPAYVYLFAEAMLKGAVAQGFDEAEIYPAVLQSLIGSFEMLKNSKKTPSELISAVAVPGGTTEAALKKLNEGDFSKTIAEAMLACTERADELTEENCK
ncbi:MAG: pyrroline-5-carboxylate reductase [Oscillospiraceae bacterium]|nr:pyrroline-5-carboxylate reductase [Oscillospiraceae bacterium]